MLGSAGKSLGKEGSPLTLSTASLTFLKASSGVTEKSNLISIDEYP